MKTKTRFGISYKSKKIVTKLNSQKILQSQIKTGVNIYPKTLSSLLQISGSVSATVSILVTERK